MDALSRAPAWVGPMMVLVITSGAVTNARVGASRTPSFVDTRDATHFSGPNASMLYTGGYVDQPYCVNNEATKEWTCVLTASLGTEGSVGEQCYSVISTDAGATWSKPVNIEKGLPGGLPNSYANIVLAPELNGHRGRLFTIYNLNILNVTVDGRRNDELGKFFMRWSDDGGRHWSPTRIEVPYASTWIDRHNSFAGNKTLAGTRMMWTVDQVKVRDGRVFFAFTKIGKYIQAPPEEVFVLSSADLLHASPADVTWELLPSGDHGIRPPAAYPALTTVMEEGHVLPLQNSSGFVVMARTDVGFLAEAVTTDATGRGGWGETQLAKYFAPSLQPAAPLAVLADVHGPNGTRFSSALKHPRAPFTPKLMPNGVYLLLYFNQWGKHDYFDRDPYWLSAGFESADGRILWSQPEVILYDRADHRGTPAGGYPDFIVYDAADEKQPTASSQQRPGFSVAITAAQKGVRGEFANSTASLHRVDADLLAGLFAQRSLSALPRS